MSGCVTEGGAEPGVNCVFPFTYHGVEYNGCTTVDNHHEDEKSWCLTKPDFDEDEDHGWGYCPTTCQQHEHGNV